MTGSDRSVDVFGRIETPAEHAIADDYIEAARLKVSAEIRQRVDDVPVSAVSGPGRIDVDGPELTIGEPSRIVARVPVAADEENTSRVRASRDRRKDDLFQEISIMRPRRLCKPPWEASQCGS